jgi:uncharacterized SAM-binding protein YcdF (DUF218 family)
VVRRFAFRTFLLLLVLAVAAFFTRSRWLPWVAAPLVRDDGPAKADIAVVLGGDVYGHRIERAAMLVRDGYVPRVLVSGPRYFDAHECDAAILFAIHKGYPAEWFVALPHSALSTSEEALVVLEELRRLKLHSYLLVTSDYHSARAARIFRGAEQRLGDSAVMRVVPADDEYFRVNTWWQSREGEKTVFIEWWKALAGALGK